MAKAKQRELAGVEITRIPAVTKAARAYIEARDERMGLAELETQRKQELMGAMKRAGVEEYVCDGVKCWLVHADSVKAKKVSPDED